MRLLHTPQCSLDMLEFLPHMMVFLLMHLVRPDLFGGSPFIRSPRLFFVFVFIIVSHKSRAYSVS